MKLKQKICKLLKWGAILTSPFFPVWIWGPTDLVETLYPNATQQQAVRIIEEEKSKLDINEPVDLIVYPNNELREFYVQGYCGISPDREGYVIGANLRDLDRILIRHELYHIKKDKKKFDGTIIENSKTALDYFRHPNSEIKQSLDTFYFMEPRANIYSITGIKL